MAAPLDHGSNVPAAWSRNALIFGALGVANGLLALAFPPPRRGTLPALPVSLMVLVLAFIGLQLVPLPTGLANPVWSSASLALLGQLGAFGSISVDSDLTALAGMRLITGLIVVWLAIDLTADDGRAVQVLGVVALAGVLYVIFGFFGQPAASSGPRGAFMSSVFFNRNNFATYTGLSIVCLAGLIIRQFRSRIANAGGQARLQWAEAIDVLFGTASLPLLGALLMVVALLLTGSRAGIASSLFGLVVLSFALRAGKRTLRAPAIAALMVLAVLVAGSLIAGEVFRSRVETAGIDDPNRFRVYVITLRSIAASPWLGYGYGTFERVFPMFRDASLDAVAIWEKAHSSYLEIFQGLGVVVGSAFLAAWGLLVRLCYRHARAARRNATAPAVAVACSALVATHSLVDFGLQIQAIALTYGAVLGAGLSQALQPLMPEPQVKRDRLVEDTITP